MSIIAYAGQPRQGKSYSVVENVIIPALKQRRHVAHNLMLNLPALSVVIGFDVAPYLHQVERDSTPAELMEKCPPGAVIVIDEAWRYWPAGVKVNEVPRAELAFFKEHGHRVGEDGLASEIILIDQDPKTALPAWMRALIELTYIYTKHSSLGSSKRFRCDVYNKCQSIEKPSRGALLRTLQGQYKPEVYNCYISHTQSVRLGEAGLEKMPDGRANLLKGWTFRAAVIAVLVFPLLCWIVLAAARNVVEGPAKARAVQQAKAHAVASRTPSPAATLLPAAQGVSVAIQKPAAPTPIPTPTPTPYSKLWRVSGGAIRPDGSGTVLLVSVGGQQRISATDCTIDIRKEWRCIVEDGIATYFSGSGGIPASAAVAPGYASEGPPLSGSPQAQGL